MFSEDYWAQNKYVPTFCWQCLACGVPASRLFLVLQAPINKLTNLKTLVNDVRGQLQSAAGTHTMHPVLSCVFTTAEDTV